MSTQRGTPAGWYTAEPGVERWWDGYQWGPQARPVAQAPRKSVTYRKVKTNHTLHLILTILTGGLWGIFVWLPITLLHKVSRERVVTRYR